MLDVFIVLDLLNSLLDFSRVFNFLNSMLDVYNLRLVLDE
jgi:hypothetical protein